MKKLIVGLVCLCFAFSSVIANDQIISTYEVVPFDQHVSDEIIPPLVGTSEIEQEQDESLCNSKSGTICPIKLQRVSQILQEQNAPFTPLVRKATFEGREVVLSLSQLDVELEEIIEVVRKATYEKPKVVLNVSQLEVEVEETIEEKFQLLNLSYGFRNR